MIDQALLAATERFENWIKNQALPLWASSGIQPELNASFERLYADGRPDLKCNIRARVQARQAFVFACAEQNGWCQHGAETARKIQLFIDNHLHHPTKPDGYVHLMNARFEVIDTRQDLYDHAFFLLALAWNARLNPSTTQMAQAETLFGYIDKHYGSKYGGWIEGDYVYSLRRQNPHMHLLEAFLALYDTSGDSRWLDRASHIYSLFDTAFFDHENQVLLEYFDTNWDIAKGPAGELVEPGHLMEWVWLLHNYSLRSGVDVQTKMQALYTKAMNEGRCSDTGLLFDEITVNGDVLKSTKRLWPMTEFIKANIAMAQLDNSNSISTSETQKTSKFEHEAAQGITLLFDYYINQTHKGCYSDSVNQNNEIVPGFTQASTLYHLIVSAAEARLYCISKTNLPTNH